MAIILNSNPLPRTGALYVSNPRKRTNTKRRKNAIAVRENYAKDRMIARESGKTLKQLKAMKRTKAGYKKFQALFRKYGGKKALTAYRKEGKATRASVKDGSYKYSTWGKKTKKKTKKKAPTFKELGLTIRRLGSKAKLSGKRGLNTIAKRQKKIKTLRAQGKTEKAFEGVARANPTRRRKNVATKTSGRKIQYKTFNSRLKGCGLTSKQKSALWAKYKSSGKLPALAQSKASSVKKSTGRKTTTKRKSTARKKLSTWNKFVAKHSGSGKTWKQLSKLYKAAHGHSHGHKKTRKKPAKRHGHKHSHRPKSSKVHKHGHRSTKAKLGDTLRKLGYTESLSAKSLETVAQRKAKIAALRAKGATMKASEGVRTGGGSSKKRKKPSKSSYLIWQTMRKKARGGAVGFRWILKEDWVKDKPKIEKLIAKGKTKHQAVKEVVAAQYGARKWSKSGKSHSKRGKTLGGGIRGRTSTDTDWIAPSGTGKDYKVGSWEGMFSMLNPKKGRGRRRNPSHVLGADLNITTPFASGFSIVGAVQDFVAKVPVLGMAAPFIAPIGMAAIAGGTLALTAKYVGPELQKYTAGTMLRNADRYGYFLSGSVLALGLGAAHKYLGVFDKRAIARIGGMAIFGGAMIDYVDWQKSGGGFLSYLGLGGIERKVNNMAGIAVNKGAIQMNPGYGDGGLYYLQGTGQGHSPIRNLQRAVGAPQSHQPHSPYSGISQSLSGAANASGAPTGYGALMYTGAGY